MAWFWFWQGLLLGLLLFWIGMLIFVKSKILKGIGLAFLVGITIFAFIKVISLQQQITTTQNVQEKVFSWLNNFQLFPQDETGEKEYFKYKITLFNKDTINIYRSKNQNHYLIVQQSLKLKNSDLKNYSQSQIEELLSQIKIKIAQQKMNFMIVDKEEYKIIYLEKRVPIGAGLTEDVLINLIDEMDSTIFIVKETFIINKRKIQM